MVVDKDDSNFLTFLKKAGREGENAEAWLHALADIKESTDKIFNNYLPLCIDTLSPEKSRELLWTIREELRHIQYHIEDIEGR